MMTTTRERALLVTVTLLSSIAAVDAAVGGAWDLVVLCAAVAGLVAVLLAAGVSGRTAVRLRPDLVRWLQRTAAAGGERPCDVADRAVAAHRAGLTGHRPGSS